MRDYLEPMLGTTGAMIAQFAITLVVLALIILVVFWLIRTFTGGGLGASAPRGRQPRLSILDALPVDQKRRLVLVRRDNVEHLILIGGPSDLVVEGSIHRPSAAQRRAEAAARSAGQQQRYASAPLAESGTVASAAVAQDAYADEPAVAAPEQWRNEPPRQEAIRQDYERQEPLAAEPREEPRREEPRRDEPRPDYREPREPRRDMRQEPRVDAVRTETVQDAVIDIAPEPVAEPVAEPVEPQVEPAAPARALPPKPVRAATSFLGSIGRSRTVAEPAAEAPAEPRRPEPPARPLGRTTPLAPKAPEPPVVEPAEIARQPEPVRQEPLRQEPVRQEPVRNEPARHEPVRMEPVRPEPVRPQPRAAMPPAPPVAPPSLGDEPYGAPNSDPDAAPRFEPIFDIDPNDVRDPGRPVRPARESVMAAPSIAPQRPFDQEPAGEAAFEPTVRAEADDRAASVGDLEKEMARLLGEISGTRRS